MQREPHAAAPDDDPEEAEQGRTSQDAFLVFTVRGASLAVPAQAVEEVRIRPASTFVPRAPDYVLGMINLRGHAVPVIDLGQFLGLLDLRGAIDVGAEGTSFDRVAVVCAAGMRVGLLCDHVRGVIELRRDSWDRPAVIQGDRLRQFALGEVEQDTRMVLLLDLPALLEAARVRG